MTTATADTTQAGTDQTTTDGTSDEVGTPTESLLTGQEGDEAVDSEEVEAAMLQGFDLARTEAEPEGKKPAGKDEGDDDADPDKTQPGADTTKEKTTATLPEADDPDVPGLGMKASEVKAMFGKVGTLEKALASANGHIGNLKQQLTKAGTGKPITAEMLPKIREEYGQEFAESFASDLNAAGIGGGGGAVDEATLEQMLGTRVEAQTTAFMQNFERRQLKKAHKDAADYFNGGPHHADFLKFVGALPKDRQEVLAETWDSDVLGTAIQEFKDHKAKVETEKTKQQQRTERAVAPTRGASSTVQPASVDPITAGWNNVKGRSSGNRPGARAR